LPRATRFQIIQIEVLGRTLPLDGAEAAELPSMEVPDLDAVQDGNLGIVFAGVSRAP
jgi:hypothetical protein